MVEVFRGSASVVGWWDAAYQIPRDLTFGPLLDACKAGEFDKCGQGIGQTEAAAFVLLIPGVEGAAAPAVAVDAARAAELATAEAEAAAIAEAAAAQADAAAAAAEARALAEATRAAQAARAGETLAGSGPVPGVLEASERVRSLDALRNYYPKEGVPYVFDPETGTFAVGRPSASVGFKGSPHEQLAQSIGADPSTVVGGTLTRGSDGVFKTTEQSGHFWRNWTPEVREQFVDTMLKYGFDVSH